MATTVTAVTVATGITVVSVETVATKATVLTVACGAVQHTVELVAELEREDAVVTDGLGARRPRQQAAEVALVAWRAVSCAAHAHLVSTPGSAGREVVVEECFWWCGEELFGWSPHQ